MASSKPIVKQIRFISIVPQLSFMGLIMFIYFIFEAGDPIIYGAITYLIISVIVRRMIPKYHRKGIILYKKGLYEEAIPEFQKSYDFFRKYRWIDKYRFIILLSSSRISYLEMAMINMAFCYAQLGNGTKSKELYEKALKEFPDSEMAKTSLKMFDAAKEIEK